ncbi:MAG: preprotein translocase subunit YajC [Gemmatimonadota bacterium]|nr:preprotein translocase subunit YajC [Gemmatimonadota bacterium]
MNVTALLMLAQPREGANGAIVFLVQMVLFFLILYWLFIRPQRKEQERFKAMVEAIKKGDEVVTTGGVIGTVVHVADDRLTIKSGESRLVIERARIGRILGKDSAEAASGT